MTKSAKGVKKEKATKPKIMPLKPVVEAEPVVDDAVLEPVILEPVILEPVILQAAPEPQEVLEPEFAEDNQPEESSGYTRSIEVRLARPQPRIRYEKGEPVREPMPDQERIIGAIAGDLTRALQTKYGTETEIFITSAHSPSVRLLGQFADKTSVVGAYVQEVLERNL